MKFNTVGKNITPRKGAYEFFNFEGFNKYGKKNKLNNSKINDDKKSGSDSKKDSKMYSYFIRYMHLFLYSCNIIFQNLSI